MGREGGGFLPYFERIVNPLPNVIRDSIKGWDKALRTKFRSPTRFSKGPFVEDLPVITLLRFVSITAKGEADPVQMRHLNSDSTRLQHVDALRKFIELPKVSSQLRVVIFFSCM